MNTFLTILLQAEAGQQSSMSFWIMMILIFVVMWLFMIRPQRKKQQELEKQRNEMKPGDKVVTAGGIHGKIDKIQDDTMLIEVAKGVTIKIDKSSIFAEPAPVEAAKKAEKKEIKDETKDSL